MTQPSSDRTPSRLSKRAQGESASKNELSPRSGSAIPSSALIVDLPSFEGPLDLLLELAKSQKVDLAEISILTLVDQFLAFVKTAKSRNLDLAADYLVMAAVLAYLKSRLLLPPIAVEAEAQDPAEVAAALARRLKRLNAMKQAGADLWALPQLGQSRFATLRTPPPGITTRVRHTASLYDFLNAYAQFKKRVEASVLHIKKPQLYQFEEALARVQSLLKIKVPTWTRLQDFLPNAGIGGELSPIQAKSALAATLLAGLELTKQGKLELKQDEAFGPVYMRNSPAARDLSTAPDSP